MERERDLERHNLLPPKEYKDSRRLRPQRAWWMFAEGEDFKNKGIVPCISPDEVQTVVKIEDSEDEEDAKLPVLADVKTYI